MPSSWWHQWAGVRYGPSSLWASLGLQLVCPLRAGALGPPACPETTTAPAKTNRELKFTQEAPSWAWLWHWLCLDPQEHAHHPSSDPAAT